MRRVQSRVKHFCAIGEVSGGAEATEGREASCQKGSGEESHSEEVGSFFPAYSSTILPFLTMTRLGLPRASTAAL